MARNLGIDANSDMAQIKQMMRSGEPVATYGGRDAGEDAALFERALNGKDYTPTSGHPDSVADDRMVKRAIGNKTEIVRNDPSVHDWDMLLQGEPAGSVPMETTMQRPAAAYPIRRGGGF